MKEESIAAETEVKSIALICSVESLHMDTLLAQNQEQYGHMVTVESSFPLVSAMGP
jgi:hypothetical protein